MLSPRAWIVAVPALFAACAARPAAAPDAPSSAAGGCSPAPPHDADCAYVAAVHAKLHTPYKVFVGNLPPYGPLAGVLSVELALAIDSEGRLSRYQVTRSSGQIGFDDGVAAALQGVAAYPKPPASLQTRDGHVHLLWSFHNGASGCGIRNAQVIGEAPSAASAR